MEEQKVGVVVHYFPRASAAAVELTEGELSVGDTIRIRGHGSDFEQTVESMQLENVPITHAEKGQTIGIKVNEKVRPKAEVFKVV